ncbi:MAG: YraN family protein [Blautia sp.]|nr:YraN family protein [Blautia sp.]
MNKRHVGQEYEEKAARYLEEQGLMILERNFRCRQGEVDLIARDGKYIVFVEVKFRRSPVSGKSIEAVDIRKQKVICRTALYYLTTRRFSVDIPCRFDVVGIDTKEEAEEILWIRDAFDYQ